MRNVKLLLDRGRLTEEQLEQFSLVKRLLRQRCQTYLFNPQHANSITAGYTPSVEDIFCLLYTSPSPRDRQKSRMPSSA